MLTDIAETEPWSTGLYLCSIPMHYYDVAGMVLGAVVIVVVIAVVILIAIFVIR